MAVSPLTRVRVPFGFLFAAAYLWLVWHSQLSNLIASTTLVLIGCALRSWAAGYLLKGKRVAVGGPYAYVRNPLYLGSFIIGFGFCLALYQAPLPLAVTLFCVLYVAGFVILYLVKSRSEEEELRRSLGSDYLAYREKVPLFLPLRGRVSGLGEQHFSAELYQKNREYQCVWGCMAILAFLHGKAYFCV